MAVSTDIRAEWRESRWLRLLCRLRKASSHEMGILSLRTAEACTLGRLLGKDEAGNVIFILIDALRCRLKCFVLDASAFHRSVTLTDEAGAVLVDLCTLRKGPEVWQEELTEKNPAGSDAGESTAACPAEQEDVLKSRDPLILEQCISGDKQQDDRSSEQR